MKLLIAMQAVHANDVLKNMTKEALASIKCDEHHWSVWVDDRDVCLAEKWNEALKMGIKMSYDYVFLVNNDILFDPKTIDNLVKFAEENKQYLVVGPSQYFEGEAPNYSDAIDTNKVHWSFVVVRPSEIVEKIGFCETQLKRGSFVDTEWHIRIRKVGGMVCRTDSSWFFHWNDSTHKFLPEYRNVFFENESVVKQKWGPHEEYEHPYDNPALDIKFIGYPNGTQNK